MYLPNVAHYWKQYSFLVGCIITHKNKVIQHQTLEHRESFVLENANLGILKAKEIYM